MITVVICTVGAICLGVLISEAIVYFAEKPMTNQELEKAKAYCRCGSFHHGPIRGIEGDGFGKPPHCAACGKIVSVEEMAECLHVRQKTLEIMATALQKASTR